MEKKQIQQEKEDDAENHISNFSDRFYRSLYELIFKVHMGKTASLDEYFGLIFKAMKSDQSIPRIVAFIKRLLQMSYLNEANFTAATLVILNELFRIRKDVKLALFQFDFKQPDAPTKKSADQQIKLDQAGSDDSEEENFIDVDKLQDEIKTEVKTEEKKIK